MTAVRFSDLGLDQPILRAIRAKGYEVPTAIQAEVIEHVLDGRDVLGIAQTGSGKTAAFALPVLQMLGAADPALPGRPIALVLAPTRELASQVCDDFKVYGRQTEVRQAVIYGGVTEKPQIEAVGRGVDVLVATPDRLLALLDQGHLSLDDLEILVLDDADRMLDMGLIADVERILDRAPAEKQSLLFSETMQPSIAKLSGELLRDSVCVVVAPEATSSDRIDQRVVFIDRADKPALLVRLLDDPTIGRALVFTRTKHRANQVAKSLGRTNAAALHGNELRDARERALDALENGRINVLVVTDFAARTIDVDGVTHVINYDLPSVPQTYVRRIERASRTGAKGTAISLCGADERAYLVGIEELLRRRVPVFDPERAGDLNSHLDR